MPPAHRRTTTAEASRSQPQGHRPDPLVHDAHDRRGGIRNRRRRRATTAIVTIHHGGDTHEERITPTNVIRSGWINPHNPYAAPLVPQILVQIAAERVIRRLDRGVRSANVDIETTQHDKQLTSGQWAAYPLQRPWMKPHGTFTIEVGADECLAAVSELLP